MADPTEWTYGGQVDWTSASTLKFTPLELVLKCINTALKERADATPSGYTLPSILTTYNPMATPLSYTDAIQEAVTELGTNQGYAENKNWDTAVSIIDLTEARILTIIGDEERLTVDKFSSDITAWLIQQYEIINVLNSINIELESDDWLMYDNFGLSAPGATIQIATDSAISQAIGRGLYKRPATELLGNFTSLRGEPGSYLGFAFAQKNSVGTSSGPPNFEYDVDIYFWSNVPLNGAYDNAGLNLYQDAYGKIATEVELSGATYTSELLGNYNFPVYPTVEIPIGWHNSLQDVSGIFKLTGTNGFKFKDW